MSRMSNLKDREATVLIRLKKACRSKPATKKELMAITGFTERYVRAIIGDLRDAGYRVCEDSASGGYWLARNDSDYKIYRNEYISRIRVQSNRLKAMDNMCPNQTEMAI